MNKALVVAAALGTAAVLLLYLGRRKTFFGRSRRRFFLALRDAPQHLFFLVRAVFVFRQPLQFLYSYIFRHPLKGRRVHLRNGIKLLTSDSPDDAATLFCVFVRHDYGDMPQGGIVIDVGANIGLFSVYALTNGAAFVYAIEPAEESFHLLKQNLRLNGLEARACCMMNVISGSNEGQVLFPKASDPSNSTFPEGSTENWGLVSPVTLDSLLQQEQLATVDLLKLDCEGAEYTVVFDSDAESWRKIKTLKMEYHRGHPENLVDHLVRHGYTLLHHKQNSVTVGHLWLARS